MSQAYALGFRGVCARSGVSPEGLVKAAQKINPFLHPLSRYWQLMTGGNKSLKGMKSFLEMRKTLDTLAGDALINGKKPLFDKIHEIQKHLSRSANSSAYYYALPDNIMSQLKSVGFKPRSIKSIPALSKITLAKGTGSKSIISVSDDVREELAKVVSARLGTMAAVPLAGGTLMAANAIPKKKKRKPRRFYNHFLDND